MNTHLFHLYISGRTVRSERAYANLTRVSEQLFPKDYQSMIKI